MLGKKQDKSTTGSTGRHHTALQAPIHNCGKDEYVVDMTGHETHYWQGTESGLLGAFEFTGACVASYPLNGDSFTLTGKKT